MEKLDMFKNNDNFLDDIKLEDPYIKNVICVYGDANYFTNGVIVELIIRLDNDDEIKFFHCEDYDETIYLEKSNVDLKSLVGAKLLAITSEYNKEDDDRDEIRQTTTHTITTDKGVCVTNWIGFTDRECSLDINILYEKSKVINPLTQPIVKE